MIELIFVIVILGILAAVAVPRLAGVQDDAMIATEQSGVGAIRSGIQAAQGKIMLTQGTAATLQIQKPDGTEVGVTYNKNTAGAGGTTNNRPHALSITNADALTFTAANDDYGFAVVLDAGSDRSSWTSKVNDTNNTVFVGKASSSLTTGDINNTGRWIYRPSGGAVAWQATPYN